MILERTVTENAWQLDDGLWRILLPLPWNVPFVSVYLVQSGGQTMLIDCGLNWGPSLRALGRALKAIGVPSGGLTYILLTHNHSDHGGAAGAVQKRWGGLCLMHEADIRFERPNLDTVHHWLAEHGMEEPLRTQAAKLSSRQRDAKPLQVEPLTPEAPLTVGSLTFEMLPAPGHSPGHVMVRERHRQWLFCADQILPAAALNVWHYPGMPQDTYDPMGDYLASLKAAGGLRARLVLPSHGAPWRGGLAQGAAAMTQFHEAFIGQVFQALTGRRTHAWDLTRATRSWSLDHLEDAQFSLSGVLAALVYLRGKGAVWQGSDGLWEQEGKGEGICGASASVGSV